MTILTKNPQAVFIHVPKNAGTSISYWLRVHIPSQNVKRKHDTYETIKNKYGDDLGFSFAVVRNPWERLVSAWLYNKRVFESREKYENIESKIGTKKKGKVKTKYENIARLKKIILTNDFEHFIYSRCWSPVEVPQVVMTEGVNKILFYETLKKDFEYIQDFYGVYDDLPMENTTHKIDYKDFYNEKTKNIVYQSFILDIKKYKYEF